MSLSITVTSQSLSSAKALSADFISSRSLCLTTKLSNLSLINHTSKPYRTTLIRMGGGPRTYPGGVSKWQWKRMQAKKAKQLLKARLATERQIYEMRKRAELKAAVSELERPWETVEKPPNLFSVDADEQLKVLADRFQKPGGLDLWSERDGPELFRADNGLPSARFFPKGVVHSVKPYRKTYDLDAAIDDFESFGLEEESGPGEDSENLGKLGVRVTGYDGNSRINQNGLDNGRNVSDLNRRSLQGVAKQSENMNFQGNLRKKESSRMYLSDSGGKRSGDARFHNRESKNVFGYEEDSSSGEVSRNLGKNGLRAKDYGRNSRSNQNGSDFGKNVGDMRRRSLEGVAKEGKIQNFRGNLKKNGSTRMYSSDTEGNNSMDARFHNRDERSPRPGGTHREFRRSNSYTKKEKMNSEVFDMSLRKDGTYGLELES